MRACRPCAGHGSFCEHCIALNLHLLARLSDSRGNLKPFAVCGEICFCFFLVLHFFFPVFVCLFCAVYTFFVSLLFFHFPLFFGFSFLFLFLLLLFFFAVAVVVICRGLAPAVHRPDSACAG